MIVQKIKFSKIPFLAGKFKFNVGVDFIKIEQKITFCISVRWFATVCLFINHLNPTFPGTKFRLSILSSSRNAWRHFSFCTKGCPATWLMKFSKASLRSSMKSGSKIPSSWFINGICFMTAFPGSSGTWIWTSRSTSCLSHSKSLYRLLVENSFTLKTMKNVSRDLKIDWALTVFENHRKSLIQHCERSELRLHFEWTEVN